MPFSLSRQAARRDSPILPPPVARPFERRKTISRSSQAVVGIWLGTHSFRHGLSAGGVGDFAIAADVSVGTAGPGHVYRGETPAKLDYGCINLVYYAYASVAPDGIVYVCANLVAIFSMFP